LYTHYNPENLGIVDAKIARYNEHDLIETLIRKYGVEPEMFLG
jgi:hypothetical protein